MDSYQEQLVFWGSFNYKNSKNTVNFFGQYSTLRSLLNKLARLTVLNTVKQASLFDRDLRVDLEFEICENIWWILQKLIISNQNTNLTNESELFSDSPQENKVHHISKNKNWVHDWKFKSWEKSILGFQVLWPAK